MENTPPIKKDNKVQHKTKSTTDNTMPETQITPTQAPRSRHWLLTMLVFICLLLCISGFGAGYYFYAQLQHKNHQLFAQIDQQQQTQQANLTQALAKFNTQVLTLMQQQAHVEQSLKAFESLPIQQKQLNERLTILAQRNPEHWKAAEANYLVKMAGRKLWLEQDIVTALALLKSADEQIDAMKDPALLPVRKALAQDIASVLAIKNVDVTGTVLKLDGLIQILDNLPLNQAEMKTNQSPASTDKKLTSSITDWHSNLTKTWQALTQDFITVSHRSSKVLPLLSPEQKWYLVENIRSKLLQAQLALYRHDETNYRNSLNIARDWIYQYYDLSSPKVKQVLKLLDTMMKLKLDNINIVKFQSSPLLMQLTSYGNLLPQALEEPK